MNVLLTSHRFWPSVGGTEEVVAQLAKAFAAKGHAVSVFTSDEPDAKEEEWRDGYRIRRFALRRAGKFRFPPKRYREAVLAEGWDVVHLHGQRVWSTDYLYRHLARANAPVVFTAHGFYQWHVERTPLVDALYYRRVMPRALAKCAAVTALTSAEREELRAWGVPDARVIPDGFDPTEATRASAGFRRKHGFGPTEPLLLYVGGFYRNKRVDRLVQLAADAGASLAVIGKEHHAEHGQAECEALAKRVGAKAKLLGALPRDDVRSAYREADLFVLGSDFEGFGLVLLEAMAAGLPFVSTPAGAAPDLAALGAGLCVAPGEMAGAVRGLLADAPRRAAMGKIGRERAQDYAWPSIAERYLALYEEVARK